MTRENERKYKYRVTPGMVRAMLTAQQDACAICRAPITYETAHVDHRHSCCDGKRSCGSCVRGLLCCKCNVGLGYLERAGWLDSATTYLTRY